MKRSILLILSLTLAAAGARADDAPKGKGPSDFMKYGAVFQSKCAKCHTIGRGDRVGPDLKGLSERRDKAWIVGYLTKTDWYLDNDPKAKELLKTFNVRMTPTGFDEKTAGGVAAYIDAASKGPVGPEEEPELAVDDPQETVPLPDEGTTVRWPGVAAAVLLAVLGAAACRFGFAWPGAALLAVAVGLGYWNLGGRQYHFLTGDQRGYSPSQPIAYSHKLHAGTLKIDCRYCHYGAERSDVAGVPPVQVCMNCHQAVRKTAAQKEPSAEIAKLVAVWESRASTAPLTVSWSRIHDLPDYAHFSHRVHLADGIKCQECHGPVQTMEKMRQAAPLTMGWCLECHRRTRLQAPTHWKRTGGPRDCSACHW